MVKLNKLKKYKVIIFFIIIMISIIFIILFNCKIKSKNNNYLQNNYEFKCMNNVSIVVNNINYDYKDISDNKINIIEYLDSLQPNEIYRDGGSKLYIFNNYKIIRCNTVSNNHKILFIGNSCYSEIDYCN